MPTKVDLSELAVRRETADERFIAPKRHIPSRYVLPAVLVLGFAAVFAWSLRDALLSRKPVTVVPVYVSLEAIQEAGTPLFKAAGWIEPRPTAIRVTALAPGVIDRLLVVEDQAVKQGESIAQLIDQDARLTLESARATLRHHEAVVAEAQAALDAARTNLDIPAHLEMPLAEARGDLAEIEREITNLPFMQKRAEARLRLAEIDLKAKQQSRGALSGIVVETAQSEHDAATAEVEELRRRLPVLEEQRTALTARRDAALKRLELKTDERLAFRAAEAKLNAAQADANVAQVAVDEAELRLKRMTITAPTDGRILDLIGSPGTQLMSGPSLMEGRDGSTVVTMYQPEQLQVRVDVRFEDLPRVGRGGPAVIESPAVAEPLQGEVLFLTGTANTSKNTLEVKVSLDNPPAVLKPEMLVDVTFLAPETEQPEAPPSEQYRLFVPRALVESGESGSFVWLADHAEGIARRQRIELGRGQTATMVEVTAGLTVASRLISSGRESLADGDRIHVTGEDTSLGMNTQPQTMHHQN
jgi:RND family efflux transporter MFP subunit